VKVVKELGRGNFGIVYLAKMKDETLVAVKQLIEDISADSKMVSGQIQTESETLKEFISEARVLSKIPYNPYIIRLVGICGSPFSILTEFVDKGSLYDYLRQPIRMEVVILNQFFREICLGVQHLHQNAVIHRDLATRNVLLRSDPNPSVAPHCVLTDMGMARLYERENQYQKTKNATMPLKWSAPESLRNKKFNEKSDVWSLGIVCIEIYTRNTPFPDLTPMNYAINLASGKFLPSAPDICADQMKILINQCFSIDPTQRPSTASILQSIPFY